jgi:hypothetical protein
MHKTAKEATMCGKRLILLAASLLLATTWGCSSSMDSGGDDTVGDDLREKIAASGFVGVDRCIDCHQDFSWSAETVYAYLEGAHVIHDKDINAESDADCLDCHDPIGDGQLAEPYINKGNIPNEGLAAVTCEACHGTGAEHYGIGPMPDPVPNYEVCGECHNEEYPHDNPEGAAIFERYTGSNLGHIDADGRNEARCVKCHNDEGGRLYKNVRTAAQLYGSVVAIDGEVSPIQCRTCHDSHNAGKLLLDAYEIELEEFSGLEFDVSAEYATCTNCHQPHKAQIFTDGENLADPSDEDGPNGDLIYHGKRWDRVIANTHYDDPATSYTSVELEPDDDDYAPNSIEGYTMDPEDDRSCRNCHDVHSAGHNINQEWAMSGHGGYILEAKEAAAAARGNPIRRTYQDIFNVRTAGVQEEDPDEPGYAPAWVHYDWDDTNGIGGSSRGSCQRCHTATGAKNFMNDPDNYDPDNNDYSHLEGWKADPQGGNSAISGQNEMLYCWACHTDSVGSLREPGPITETYNNNPIVRVAYPDVSNSNICMSCHLGREIGEVVAVSTSDFKDTGFINSHYLASGASLFKVAGYEFSGAPDYDNLEEYLHDMINEDDEGPCVSCHMSEGGIANHTFEVVTKNASDEITAITSNVCANCHDEEFDEDVLQEFKDGYKAALEVLDEALQAEGIYFAEEYPYFYSGLYNPDAAEDDCTQNRPVRNWRKGGITKWVPDNGDCEDSVLVDGDGNTGMDRMGAAFNYNFFVHDPGAFAHNSHYTKMLIFDSIDYLDNGQLDGTIDLTGHNEAAAYLKPGYGNIAAVSRP